jgi:transposase
MSDTFSRVKVITSVDRRRRFSTDLKLAVVAETMRPGTSIRYVARRHGLSPSLVFRWWRLMSEGSKEVVRADDDVVAASEIRCLEERVLERERLLVAKRWRSRSAKARSGAGKTRPCYRRCRFREIPGEDRHHHSRRGAIEMSSSVATAEHPGADCRSAQAMSSLPGQFAAWSTRDRPMGTGSDFSRPCISCDSLNLI